MRPSPSSSRLRQRTRGWRRAKARACCWRLPTLASAPRPRTKRRARPPSSKSARPNFRVDEDKATHDSGVTNMAGDNIFSGLKVVDLASFIAGPGAAVILSDFGADVIKVEPPAGDLWRHGHQIPPQPQAKDPYPWHLANRNKRGITLDLKSSSAQPVLQRLSNGLMCSSSTRRIPHASD